MQFREYHLSKILEQFHLQRLPLDVFLNRYFRSHRALGSKDRRFIGEAVYEKIRAKPLSPELLALVDKEIDWEGRAPLTVRANPLKTCREILLEKWKSFATTPPPFSPYGIVFHQKIHLFTLPEFREGFFEIQDEASQLVALLVEAKPKDHVLDFCAGSGGKTLAFAHLLQNTGQIFLHDIRPRALQEAKKRLRRAGVQNVQFCLPMHPVDWIFVDVPCTGTGTLRRNPDLKEKFSLELLDRLVQEQREIFKKALSYLKPTGKIVYATCSILSLENESQVTYFQENFALKTVKTFQSFPTAGGMDGFFGAVFCKS